MFTGTLTSTWDMVVEGDTAHMGPADATPANATFRCYGETFALMMCGRTGLDAAIAGGQIAPEGDMTGVQTFKKWFQGVVL